MNRNERIVFYVKWNKIERNYKSGKSVINGAHTQQNLMLIINLGKWNNTSQLMRNLMFICMQCKRIKRKRYKNKISERDIYKTESRSATVTIATISCSQISKAKKHKSKWIELKRIQMNISVCGKGWFKFIDFENFMPCCCCTVSCFFFFFFHSTYSLYPFNWVFSHSWFKNVLWLAHIHNLNWIASHRTSNNHVRWY